MWLTRGEAGGCGRSDHSQEEVVLWCIMQYYKKSHVSMNELVGVEKCGGGEGSPADPAGVGPPWGPTPTLQVGPQTTTEEEALATVLT